MTKTIKSQSTITGERLMKIETTLDYLKIESNENKSDHKEIKVMIEKFIESADKKYATKEELKSIKENFKDTKDDVKDIRNKYIDLAIKVAGIAATIALITKLSGVW